MSCDLTSGRLLSECNIGRAGIKTLYFAKFNDYDTLKIPDSSVGAAATRIVVVDGEITDMGGDAINLYQFDMSDNVGMFDETMTSSEANGTSFVTQTITMTLHYIKPGDLATLNNIRKGRWAIWVLDFNDKIRLFGMSRGSVAVGGSDVSGTAPGDKKGLDLTFVSTEEIIAPFMADYTTVPFDNFTNVTVIADDAYGPELHTDANAASDPNGNEANATTGWTGTGLTGTGANVFESQSSVVNTGTYALHADANDTPTSGAKIEKSFTGLDDGATYLLSFDYRHIGTGSAWACFINHGTGSINIQSIITTDTVFATFSNTYTTVGTSIIVTFSETSGSNNGGIYLDNFSLKKVL